MIRLWGSDGSGLFVKSEALHPRVLSRKCHDLMMLLDDSGDCEEKRLKKGKSKSRDPGRGTIATVQTGNGMP